jgi:hypothetical protein
VISSAALPVAPDSFRDYSRVCGAARTVSRFGGCGCDTVDMGYVLGSQVESMAFTDAGAQYEPAGAAHAVDTESETHVPDAVVGYAACGAAVRVWPDLPFDPDGANLHSRCAAIARGNRQPA